MLSRLLLGGLFGFTFMLSPVKAEDRFEQLYDIGRNACGDALRGDFDEIDGAFIAAAIEAGNMTQADYCHCVAMEFTDIDDDDLKLLDADSLDSSDHFSLMVRINTVLCLPFGDRAEDDELTDWDWTDDSWADDQPEEEAEDVRMCQMTLDDDFMTPGYNAADVLRRLDRSGQSRDQLCGCAERYFVAGGAAMEDDIANADNPTLAYASIMGDAIHACL